MTLHTYLRNLSAVERRNLAKEIGSSDGYLRMLQSNKERLASITLAQQVLDSELNKTLPESLQFCEDDYLSHRQACIERKARFSNKGDK